MAQLEEQEEIGTVYFTPDLGHFVVYNIDLLDDRADVYMCDTGDLGRLTLALFRADVREGAIVISARFSEVVRCPTCRGAVRIIRNGLVDGEQAPFVSCDQCAYCEEL